MDYKDDILKELEKLTAEVESEKVIITRTANERIRIAASRPQPKMLFDEFWFENELCILFAGSNVGKSILAVQIADSITQGYNISEFKMHAEPQNVAYFDAELSDKQFQLRYTDETTNKIYQFDDKFFTQELDNPSGDSGDEILTAIIEDIIKFEAKILIIDNLSYLDDDNEKAKRAIPLLKKLKALKKKYGLSILVLAHTPKRDESKPLHQNDLAGSKMLINLCDSAFAIGSSTQSNKDNQYRYVKQIKVRNAKHRFTSDNVCLFEIQRKSLLLQFVFVDYTDERDHLKEVTQKDREIEEARIIELKEKGLSYRDIAKDDEVHCSHTQVKRILEKINAV